MCLVFDCVPSNQREVFWKYTLNDIRVRLKLYLGEKQSEALQTYESLVLVAGQLFGDGKKSKSKASSENEEVVSTKEGIAAKMKELFG